VQYDHPPRVLFQYARVRMRGVVIGHRTGAIGTVSDRCIGGHMKELKDRIAVVTGAARGIGRAMANIGA